MSTESTAPREDSHINSSVHQGRTGCHWGVAVACLAVAGAGLVFLSTAKYGAGISPDSTDYLDVARSLTSGKGFVFHTGKPLVWWPPLYPMLLALVGFATRLDPAVFAHLVNAALFATVICLSARLFQPGSRQTTNYSVLGVCAVLLSIPLSEVYAMAWSECLFLPLVLLYLVFAQRYWDSGDMLPLAVMTLSTALACLTRYAGVALVPAGVVTIFFASRVNFKTRFSRAFCFAAASLAPLGLWGARNYRLTGTFFGNRGPFKNTLADSVIVGAKTMLLWYVPGRVAKYAVLAGIAIALVAAISSRAARRRVSSGLKAILRDHTPAMLLLVALMITLLAAATRDAACNSRMLSPVYVPATLVLLTLASRMFSPVRLRTTAFASGVASVLLVVWLCFPFASVARDTAGRLRDGAGIYNTKTWRESETVAHAEQMHSTNGAVRVYSNAPDALRELARVNATQSPDRRTGSLSDLEGHWPARDGSVLVWFESITWRKYLFSAEELGDIADVEEVAHFSDGSIYRVSARQAVARDSSP
jgi:hypothetical protein